MEQLDIKKDLQLSDGGVETLRKFIELIILEHKEQVRLEEIEYIKKYHRYYLL